MESVEDMVVAAQQRAEVARKAFAAIEVAVAYVAVATTMDGVRLAMADAEFYKREVRDAQQRAELLCARISSTNPSPLVARAVKAVLRAVTALMVSAEKAYRAGEATAAAA